MLNLFNPLIFNLFSSSSVEKQFKLNMQMVFCSLKEQVPQVGEGVLGEGRSDTMTWNVPFYRDLLGELECRTGE